MSETVSEVFSNELDYSQKILNTSTPIYRECFPTNSTSVTLSSVASLGPTTFLLPSSVMNFAKTRLNFTLSIPAGQAGTFTHVNNTALAPISRITCYDSSTSALMFDVNNLQEYMAITNLAATKIEDFLTKATLYDVTQPIPVEDNQKSNAFTSYSPSGTNLTARTPTLAPLTFISGAVDSAVTINYSVPLSAIKHSIFSLDKLLYTPSVISLELHFAPTNSFITSSTDAANPTTGVTAYVPAAGNVVVSDLTLSLCNEANLAVVSSLISRVMNTSLILPCGYPTVLKQTISPSTNHAYQQQLTRGFGSKIKAIITAPFSTAGLQQNLGHEKQTLTTYQTLINNVPLLQPSPMTDYETYTIGNKQHVWGSAIQDYSLYNANFFNCDAFLGKRPLYLYDAEQTMIGGLDVSSQNSTFQLQATYSGNVGKNWITALLGQKIFSFSNQGIVVA
jgi:hypothetical protein